MPYCNTTEVSTFTSTIAKDDDDNDEDHDNDRMKSL